jgi:hypothetical protein
MSARAFSILDAVCDERLFLSAFKDLSTWRAWIAFLAALFGIALSGDDQADTFRACTARSALPDGPFAEAWLVCGRRSGKSSIGSSPSSLPASEIIGLISAPARRRRSW